MQDFPTAAKHDPVFEIGGKLYKRVSQSEGLKTVEATRAKWLNSRKEWSVDFFVEIKPGTNGKPATEPAE